MQLCAFPICHSRFGQQREAKTAPTTIQSSCALRLQGFRVLGFPNPTAGCRLCRCGLQSARSRGGLPRPEPKTLNPKPYPNPTLPSPGRLSKTQQLLSILYASSLTGVSTYLSNFDTYVCIKMILPCSNSWGLDAGAYRRGCPAGRQVRPRQPPARPRPVLRRSPPPHRNIMKMPAGGRRAEGGAPAAAATGCAAAPAPCTTACRSARRRSCRA